MANTNEVKEYLACWFQLGKQVISNNNSQVLLPSSVFGDNGYSKEFENCWELIISCARCSMPVAIRNVGVSSHICPCHNLSNWPNTDLPAPHIPISYQERLREICNKLSNS